MRKIGMIVLILILCGALVWSGLATAVFLKEEFAQEPGPADCIIVLGARVMPDGRLSTALLRRVEKAQAMYQDGLAPLIIVCGAQGSDEPHTEAAAMRAWLVEKGVPEEAIVEEDQSTSTEENLRNAMAIMEERGLKTAIVTTNAYHLTRAMWVAQKVGLDAQGAAALNNDFLHTRLKLRYREAVSWVLYWLGI